MTKAELEKEAIGRVDAFIDNFSQDIRSTLYDRLNQEDVKDFLYGLYIDIAEPREKQVQIDAEQIRALQKQNGELTDEVRKLKILVSSLVYEINQIWDINEMNDDLRMCAEKIDREVQLSKMAEDNRMVISALGFAIVPPKQKLYVKEV